MSHQGKKILVVEDDAALRIVMRDKLKSAGYHVVEAADGEAGLKLALTEHPDLMLVDVIMPKLDGLAMVGKLRQDPWGKNAAVIMLTNVGSSDSISQSLKSGAFDYLLKSHWSLDEVVRKVKEKLGAPEARAR